MRNFELHPAAACVALFYGACTAPVVSEGAMRVGATSTSATLGLRTSVPTEHVARAFQLDNNVRVHGRFVESSAGAAAEAGIQKGDVVLRLGDNDLYSQDDISDFLRVSSPGDLVSIFFKREGVFDPMSTAVTLGACGKSMEPGGRFPWQFASLAQLPQALETARAQKKKVMVGLSGAET